MVFNSYTFAIFFLIVLAFHYSQASWPAKKLFLIVASYIFYATWNPPFVLLIIVSTLVDWEIAKRIYKAATIRRRKLLLVCSLSANLGLLGFFKYSNFLLDAFVSLIGGFGMRYQAPGLDIVLPVGISFYTFQTLSYTLDVYRRRIKPWDSFVDYALFVSFFPQLVAGPIVRAREFLPQTRSQVIPHRDRFIWGISLMIIGLFQKVVIADNLMAPVVETVYDTPGTASTASVVVATLAFSVQIFCDFAGYSTIAIGAAMCLGFALPDNFRFPYAAVGFSDFWQRWHISLSSWLRDYLYISLGGNRKGRWRTYRNLLVTMFLGGLWHGASWTFVVWGLLHGGYLIVERALIYLFGGWRIWRHTASKLCLAAVTFGFVSLAWIFFRAENFTKACELLGSIMLQKTADDIYLSPADTIVVAGALGITIGLHWYLRDRSLEVGAARIPAAFRAMLLGLMVVAIAFSTGESRAFIYFQF